MKPRNPKPETQNPASPDFTELVNLLAVYTEACNQLAALQVQANESNLDLLDELKPDYARLQETVATTEATMELIALRNPQWFNEQQTIKTPYGTVRFRLSHELDIPNEEVTIILIKHRAEKAARDNALALPGAPINASAFAVTTYIRTREELDREALEKLDDATLAELRIKRVQKKNFSAKPAALDLGKAIKETSSRNLQVASAGAGKDAA